MSRSNKKIEEIRPWSKIHSSIFEKFAMELKEIPETGEMPLHGDQDLKYCLECQSRRLKERGLEMKYEIVPRGHFANGGGLNRSWKDEHYVSRMEYRTCHLSRAFYRNGKKAYEKDKDMIFYQIITDVHKADVIGEDLHGCPNCGAVSMIKVLENGCPYCGTYFKMTDLFPKVSNYFFIQDVSGTEKEVKGQISRFIIPCILLSIIGYASGVFNLLFGVKTQLSLLASIPAGIICGGILGYVVWATSTLFTLFKNAGKSMPMLINTAGSEKRFANRMKKYSPEFSYEYFSDKVVSLLKTVLFTEEPSKLPFYLVEGKSILPENIIEASYAGATALKRFYVKEGYCYVIVDVYMEDIYDNGRRIYNKDDIFRVHLRRKLGKMENFHFSISHIQCKNCGSSFNAMKQRNCPACGTEYEIDDEEWVILQIKKL